MTCVSSWFAEALAHSANPARHRERARPCVIAKLPSLAEMSDLLPDAVCVVDAEGRFLFVSVGFPRTFGHNRDEVLGLRTFDLIHPDDLAATLESARQVPATRSAISAGRK